MSPEEAIEVLIALEDWLYFSSMNGGTKIQREAIEIAIAAIKKEEEKMDDSISRQEVLDAIDEISNEVADGYGFDYAKWREYFCELPSSEPQRMRGQWSIKGQAIDTVRGYWATCSACGHDIFGGGNYCSNCGSYNKRKETE